MRVESTIDLTGIAATLHAQVQQAAIAGGEYILGESRKVVPIEEGVLETSGKVTSEVRGDTFTVAISYDTPYAARQHEETTWRHDPGRQAKYLEQPLHAGANTVAQIVRNAVQL